MKNLVFVWLIFAFSCASSSNNIDKVGIVSLSWYPQISNTTASLRGLSVVDGKVAWASGQFGTVLRTLDGGETWELKKVPHTDSIDFRDIQAFDRNTAFLLSAGSPGLIYKTADGGNTWQLQYKNTNPTIFFDGFDFRNESQGMAMGDPMDGHFVLLVTNDGGAHWKEIPSENIPASVTGEAGFAASGTGVVLNNEQHSWFATGGTMSRVFRSAKNGADWEVAETPMISGEASTGIFSLAFMDKKLGVAVGGDYVKPDQKEKNAIYTQDGGITWQLAQTLPNGYRSGVGYAAQPEILVTVGPNGSDYSTDGGIHWIPADTIGYHSIQFANKAPVGWATGSNGKIAKIILLNTPDSN